MCGCMNIKYDKPLTKNPKRTEEPNETLLLVNQIEHKCKPSVQDVYQLSH